MSKGTPKGTKLNHTVGYSRLKHENGYDVQKAYCPDCTSKEQVINKIGKDKTFLNEFRNKLGTDAKNFDDLMQDTFIALLEKKDEDIMRMNSLGQILFYLKSIVWIQVKSDCSKFFINYKRFSSKTSSFENPAGNFNFKLSQDNNKLLLDDSQKFFGDLDNVEPYYKAGKDVVEQVDKGNILTLFEKDIFERYYVKGESLPQLSKVYGISSYKIKIDLFRCIEKVKKYVVKHYEELDVKKQKLHYTKENQLRPKQTKSQRQLKIKSNEN